MKYTVLEPTIEKLVGVQEAVEDYLNENHVPLKIVTAMNIVLDELCSNVVYYSGADTLDVEADMLEEQEFSLRFTDNGTPYDPLKKEDPDVTLSAEERQIGGLGIFMVKKMTDRITYERKDDRNVLTVYKKW